MRRRIAVLLAVVLALAAVACKPEAQAAPRATPKATRSPSARPRTDLPSSMVALGDSITAGFGSCFTYAACTRNSWATGDSQQVDSQYKRILAGNPAIQGNAHNLASAGATVFDLSGQVQSAIGYRPQYVAILVGANDACRRGIDEMTSKEDFQAQLSAALKTLHAALPSARVLLVSIPDVYRVWELAHTDRLARDVWALGECQALLANPTSTAPADVARRQRFRDRIDQYDSVLAAVCQQYGPRCRYDGGAAHNARFTLDDLNTLDYFHPSVVGQSALAAATYPGSFTWG
jgi:lysophospholipase L1-like esterase